MVDHFDEFSIARVSREQSNRVDTLLKLATTKMVRQHHTFIRETL